MPTVAGTSVILGFIAIVGAAITGFVALDAHQQAVATADLTALSVAQAHVAGDPDACELGEEIVAANGATMQDCELNAAGNPTSGTSSQADAVRLSVSRAGRTAQATAGSEE